VFIAQVTPSGKLPKYSYIPELNRRIAEMVTGGADHHLFLVDMATGHDWRTMTIHDRVHPNQKGAKRMAKRWFKAIKKGQKSMKERKK
jgi:lysophospholipase L1-like esterase